MAEEDSREDLETESRDLTKFYEKLLAETKTFKSQMETLENDSLKKLAGREEAYSKHAMLVAANWHVFEGKDGMEDELTKLKKHKDKFDKKKKAFQKELGEADKELKNRPKLLDDLEQQFTLCLTAATNLQNKATELTGVFPQLSGEADKLNARIKTFNDSWKISKIPPLNILSPDLDDYPPRLKAIMKGLEAKEPDINESRKELKGTQKQLQENIDKLNAFQPAPAKPVKK
jgi:predicted  nucleic acid-binding Zn-ribbon protein